MMDCMQTASILIVDDHPVFVQGFAQLIESRNRYHIAGTAINSHDALRILEDRQPDLVIVDLNLGDEDGLALIEEIRKQNKETRILVFSMHEERYYSERVLQLGAHGYVMKIAPMEDVFLAIQTVLEGKTYLSEAEHARLLEYAVTESNLQGKEARFASIDELSTRQLQVFTLLGKGAGTIEIAAQLQLSRKTVDKHKENIKARLHCSTSQDLRQLAIEWVRH